MRPRKETIFRALSSVGNRSFSYSKAGPCLALSLLFSTFPTCWAKEPTLPAIELYNNSSGVAYIQIAELQINGKIEVRDCSSSQQISRQTYNKLPRVTITLGSILERGRDGVLVLNQVRGTRVCVVPDNLKLEKNAVSTPAELADRALLKGTPLSPAQEGDAGLPPLNKGVQLVFAAVPNLELAEYLKAARASTIIQWREYLSHFAASEHGPSARLALSKLYVADGEANLAVYEKSASNPEPLFSALRHAQESVGLALAQDPDFTAAIRLRDNIGKDLNIVCQSGNGELERYRQALASHMAGFSHFVQSQRLSEIVTSIDPQLPAGLPLKAATQDEKAAIENAITSAQSSINAKQYDKAYAAIGSYRSFAAEETRLSEIVNTTYSYHAEKAKSYSTAADWENATAEWERAAAINSTSEATNSLRDARQRLSVDRDKAAAASALQQSNKYAEQHDYIQAYESLTRLTPAQQALVATDMNQLTTLYIQNASQEAKNLQQAHSPIIGLPDEVAIQKAYQLLQRAFELSQDASFKDRMDILGSDLSEYYLQQGKHYLAKPAGSATMLGWNYLEQALRYQASNLDAIHDAMTEASPAHAMRSRLSIRVQFVDQTSQRDSTGFARQLEDAIITGLESSRLPVRVVRFGTITAVDPDFQLIGDVLQRRHSTIPTVEAIDSKYRAGEHEIPNDEWNKINREYESATLELQSAQSVLQGMQSRRKKKDLEVATRNVTAAQRRVVDAHAKLDSVPRTVSSDIIRSYTYTKETTALSGVVQLQFRIGKSLTGEMDNAGIITKENHETFIKLENVKPEDTEGIKPKGTTPDPAEFMTDLENAARDELLVAVKRKVAEIPQELLAEAKRKAASSDADGAAEAYLLYLNSTRSEDSSERQLASRFLAEHFNMFPQFDNNN